MTLVKLLKHAVLQVSICKVSHRVWGLIHACKALLRASGEIIFHYFSPCLYSCWKFHFTYFFMMYCSHLDLTSLVASIINKGLKLTISRSTACKDANSEKHLSCFAEVGCKGLILRSTKHLQYLLTSMGVVYSGSCPEWVEMLLLKTRLSLFPQGHCVPGPCLVSWESKKSNYNHYKAVESTIWAGWHFVFGTVFFFAFTCVAPLTKSCLLPKSSLSHTMVCN